MLQLIQCRYREWSRCRPCIKRWWPISLKFKVKPTLPCRYIHQIKCVSKQRLTTSSMAATCWTTSQLKPVAMVTISLSFFFSLSISLSLTFVWPCMTFCWFPYVLNDLLWYRCHDLWWSAKIPDLSCFFNDPCIILFWKTKHFFKSFSWFCLFVSLKKKRQCLTSSLLTPLLHFFYLRKKSKAKQNKISKKKEKKRKEKKNRCITNRLI